VALLVLTGWEVGGSLGIVGASGAGAFAVLVILLLSARLVKSATTLLVLGLLLGYIANGLVSILFHFTNSDRLRNYINWTLGSFSNVPWAQIPPFALVIALGLLLSLAVTQPLNALLLGESQARTLGVRLTWLRFWVLVSTALLTGSVTAFCGPIAFIGVAVPHLCRQLWRTGDHRQLWLAVIVAGASLSLLADLSTKLLGRGIVLPLNGITALMGTPIMLWLLLGHNSLGHGQKWHL
jgi:iron complex transport system permease protein